ncbi:MAG: glycosyltransferase [Chitinophagaceae bacterium]|nr:MAG: glycosyltransferase [Chitinophagaceae bacterium]
MNNILHKKAIDLSDIVELIKSEVKETVLITFLNPVSYVKMSKRKDLLVQVDRIGYDGIMLVKFMQIFYKSGIDRTSFDLTSLSPIIFEQSCKSGDGIYIIGSKEDAITKAVRNIKEGFLNINIIGYRHGYNIDNEEFIKIMETINSLKPKFIVVGMGAIKQEEFMIKIRNSLSYNCIIFSCGGYIHQTSESINYYPQFIDKYNLRMPYRIYKERLYNRLYLYVVFIFIFIKNKLTD